MTEGGSCLLSSARQCPSPNQDRRPEGCEVDLLVLHNISLPPDQYGGPWIEDLFLNRMDPTVHPYFREVHQQKVSAHLLIRRDGELLQFVPLDRRAWHAGISSFKNRERCNDFSIGIELEGSDETTYTETQYSILTATTLEIMKRFPSINPEQITGHSDIAPGRKTDPGPAFDWPRFYASLKAEQ
ncbi:1,6-anhydro-N-acetylmuramyl-L-alanine amidase AmpD [Candidatus Vondammii sp. HM_W22]|uniref:1,6-anhydro-N-acetylmuramyl-L-alanine amidase AmpD n=1 Tax=Candidatus Vondammii sp. HM_W22 TaxID=2687299 RepID=UPI001F13E9D8|nr:1,6-anhydro-N-acetylmuramyl-L-alanine amidase AmpD [Candidatus Vondammii sp. HM_W22]